jgi:hypothetical protein
MIQSYQSESKEIAASLFELQLLLAATKLRDFGQFTRKSAKIILN